MAFFKRIFREKVRNERMDDIKVGSTIRFDIKVEDESTAKKIKEMLFQMKSNDTITELQENETDECNTPLLEHDFNDTKKRNKIRKPSTKVETFEDIEMVSLCGENEMSDHERVLRRIQKRAHEKQTRKNITKRITSAFDFTKRLFKWHKRNSVIHIPIVCRTENENARELQIGVLIKNNEEYKKYKFYLQDETSRSQNQKRIQNIELFLKYSDTPFIQEFREHVLKKIHRRYNVKAISSPEIRYLEYFDRKAPLGTWPVKRSHRIKINVDEIKVSYEIIDKKFTIAKRRELQKLLIHIEKVGKIKVVRSTDPPGRYRQENFTYILHRALKNKRFCYGEEDYEGEEIMV